MSSTEAALLRYMMSRGNLRPAHQSTHADVNYAPEMPERPPMAPHTLSQANPTTRPATPYPQKDINTGMPQPGGQTQGIPQGPGALMSPAVNSRPVHGAGIPNSTFLPTRTTMNPTPHGYPMPMGRPTGGGIPQGMYQTLIAR